MPDVQLHEDLKSEYLTLQGHYEGYDQRALSLKALATPLLGAGVAFGFKDPTRLLIAMTMLLSLTLWWLEATWKLFQYCYAPRMELLEKWFAGNADADPKPFQIFNAWNAAFTVERVRFSRLWIIAWRPFVFLPYLVVIVAGAVVLIARR